MVNSLPGIEFNCELSNLFASPKGIPLVDTSYFLQVQRVLCTRRSTTCSDGGTQVQLLYLNLMPSKRINI